MSLFSENEDSFSKAIFDKSQSKYDDSYIERASLNVN